MPIDILSLILLLICTAALAAAFLIGRAQRRDMERRISLVSPEVSARPTLKRAGASTVDRLARSLFSIGMKRRWVPHSTGLILIAMAFVAMAVIWTLAHLILGMSTWLALAFGAVAFFLVPQFRLRREQDGMDRQFIELFPGAIDMIVRMLRAGLPVSATVRTVSEEAASPVDTVFAELANQMDIGIPFEDAIRATAGRIGLGDFRFFAAAASLQRTTGGNLASTLEILADIIRRKRAGRLKAVAVTAEVRMTALVLGLLPLFIIGALMITRPDYLVPLVTDPRGNIIAGVAIGLLALAFVVIRQMMRSVTRAQ